MKAIKVFEQVENKSVGVYFEAKGKYLAMTLTQSKNFKSESGAFNWLARRGYVSTSKAGK